MNNLLALLSTVLPIIASSLLLLVILVNFYQKIRRKFPVSVNCWFCNTWTRVLYDDRNSFNCPECLQYNGFTKDGDYNKTIPEQHDELMNASSPIHYNKFLVSNGLCTLCNNNQQLKIIQLAKFVPMVEENYDKEIEHFQEQLEKAYKLCKKCDKILKFTLEKQNSWIFGKHVKNICSNGLSTITKLKQQLGKSKISKITRLINVFSFALTTIVLLVILTHSKITFKYIPKSVFKNITLALMKPYNIENTSVNWLEFKITPYTMSCLAGTVMQLVCFFEKRIELTMKTNRLLCWTILSVLSCMKILRSYTPHILLLQVFCCMYLLYSTRFSSNIPTRKRKSKKLALKKDTSLKSVSEFSDASDYEDISSSYRINTSNSSMSQDSSYLNLSTLSSVKSAPMSNFTTANSVLNSTFSTAKSVSSAHTLHHSPLRKRRMSVDLHKSLDNLHLGFPSSLRTVSPVFSVNSLKHPRPVLSPARLQPCNQNSWVAGGFWKPLNSGEEVAMSMSQRNNLSRSSSESSGFGSQHNDNNNFNLHSPKNNSICEFDRNSVQELSNVFRSPGSVYSSGFVPINPEFPKPHSHGPAAGIIYPNLHPNNMLFLGGNRNFTQTPPAVASPLNLSTHFLQSPNISETYERPSLFKKWPDSSSTFKNPNFIRN